MKDNELVSSSNSKEDSSMPPVTLVRKQFGGRYAISSDEFNRELVKPLILIF